MGVTYTRHGQIAFLDFEGESGNRMAPALRGELSNALEAYRADEDAWMAIVASTGPDFCVGSIQPGAETRADRRRRFHDWGGGYHEIWKPTIAAIQGRCLGEGTALALGCDFRLAGEGATFDFGFDGDVDTPNVSAAWLFTLVGLSKAAELLWIGGTITAEDALRVGLVNRIVRSGEAPERPTEGRLPMNPLESFVEVPDGSPRTAARVFAEELLLNAPVTRTFQKEIAYRSIGVPFQYAQSLEIGTNPLGSADRIEGNRAFVENRRPVWRNR